MPIANDFNEERIEQHQPNYQMKKWVVWSWEREWHHEEPKNPDNIPGTVLVYGTTAPTQAFYPGTAKLATKG